MQVKYMFIFKTYRQHLTCEGYNIMLSKYDFVTSYMGGCRVASLTPSHVSAGWGRASLRGPTGGLANGTPR